MSIKRTLRLVAKDLRLQPNSPIILYVILMPILITFMLQVVFLTLLDSKPRLAVFDPGNSRISSALLEMDEINLTLSASAKELHDLVEHHDVDAGLVLAPGFDSAVRNGARPEFNFFLSGESLASDRLVLMMTVLDCLRELEGKQAPVEVIIDSGAEEERLPLSKRLMPAVLMFVLIGAGIFFPASMLVQEREFHTLEALLVTPVKISEVLVAKATLGFVMVIGMAYLTLALNGIQIVNSAALLISIAIAALVCTEIGIIYGTVAKDAKVLYTMIKSLNIILVGPVIFYLYPQWPQWIARLFPTYWFIDPINSIVLHGATLTDVSNHLFISLGIGAILLVPIHRLKQRLLSKSGAT